MESAESYCMALSAVPDEEVGRRIAQRLLEARAAACVNLVPGLESRYWWKGEIQRDSEALLLIKTSWDRVEAVEKLLLEAHPYETPDLARIEGVRVVGAADQRPRGDKSESLRPGVGGQAVKLVGRNVLSHRQMARGGLEILPQGEKVASCFAEVIDRLADLFLRFTQLKISSPAERTQATASGSP